MKKISIITVLIVSILIFTACSDNESRQDTASAKTIDSDIVVETTAGSITKEEFYGELLSRYGEEVLQEMITLKVLNEIYEINEEQIDREVQMLKDQYGDKFEMWLQHSNFRNEEAFRQAVLLTFLQEEAKAEGVDISEEDIKERYTRMITEVNAQHILVVEEELAVELKQKLDDGADFSEMAKQYSIDSSNADDGGELGYFSTGTMVESFEIAAFALETGEVSDPVQTQFGYHIIKLIDKQEKDNINTSFEDMRDEIRRSIVEERVEIIEAQKKIAELLEEAVIDIKIEGIEDLFNLEKINAQIETTPKGKGGIWSSGD